MRPGFHSTCGKDKDGGLDMPPGTDWQGGAQLSRDYGTADYGGCVSATHGTDGGPDTPAYREQTSGAAEPRARGAPRRDGTGHEDYELDNPSGFNSIPYEHA